MLALIAESGIVLFSIPRGNSQAENDAEEDDYSAESYINVFMLGALELCVGMEVT